MTLSLIMAESAMELVPLEVLRHPSVLASAKRAQKKPSSMLLDNSWHYSAMKGMKDWHRRGRPDLVHFGLLEATSIPLYLEGKLDVYVHTINDMVITLGSCVNLPRSFHRFAGVIEKLYRDGGISSDGKKLLSLRKMNLGALLDEIRPSGVVGLSTAGSQSTYAGVASRLDDACLIVGGFQKGQFSQAVSERFTESYRIDERPLEAHVVLGRILYEYEKTIFM